MSIIVPQNYMITHTISVTKIKMKFKYFKFMITFIGIVMDEYIWNNIYKLCYSFVMRDFEVKYKIYQQYITDAYYCDEYECIRHDLIMTNLSFRIPTYYEKYIEFRKLRFMVINPQLKGVFWIGKCIPPPILSDLAYFDNVKKKWIERLFFKKCPLTLFRFSIFR